MPPHSHRPTTRPRHRWLALCLLALAFIALVNLMDRGTGVSMTALWLAPAWAPWWHAPLRMLLNAVPCLLLGGVILALTRRMLLAWVLAMGVEALLYLVNALKVANLGAPLLPADFLMLGQLGGGGGELLAGYLPHSPWPWLGIVGALVALAVLARLERPWSPWRWRWRVPVALLSAAALGSLVLGWSAWSTLYNPVWLGMQPWSPKATRAHTGMVNALVLFHLKYSGERDAPDVPAARALLARKADAVAKRERAIAAGAQGQPDIIIILSESLFDPTILNGYPAGTDLLPHLHRLARHGISGWMYPPTFGGGTIRTGFEVMTGLSLRYFPDVQFPWLQIHQASIPGIVRLLKSKGYRALAVHGNDPAFWNRTSAFKALGFDRFVSIGDFPPSDRINDGKYLSDKSFTDEMLRQLHREGPPQFLYGLSIEAHGPYNEAFGIDTKVRDAIPVPAALTGARRTHLQNYIYHIRHADAQLGRLVQALEKRHRRTIVVFFGDHLPALVPAFQQAGFTNGKGFFFQRVPYLIFDTGHPLAAPVRRNVAAWMLPGMALAQAGITDPGYYALTDILGPQLADLSRAPDAPPPQPTARQARLENGLRNVARLRLAGKLTPLWDQVSQARPAPAAGTGAATSASPVAPAVSVGTTP